MTTIVINAAIGAAAVGAGAAMGGGTGAVASPGRFFAATARISAKGLIGGTVSVIAKAAERGVDNVFFGTHHNLWKGATQSFATGAAIGVAVGAWGERTRSVTGATSHNDLPGINKFENSFKLGSFTGIRKILEPQPSNPWAGLTKEMVKVGAKFTATKVTPKIGKTVAKEAGYI